MKIINFNTEKVDRPQPFNMQQIQKQERFLQQSFEWTLTLEQTDCINRFFDRKRRIVLSD